MRKLLLALAGAVAAVAVIIRHKQSQEDEPAD